MMYLVKSDDLGAFAREVAEMHRLRCRVFRDRLNWEVTVSGDMEIDEYDAMSPVYLLHCDKRAHVDGCVRLLPTTGFTMLRYTFPALLGSEPAPESPWIWEASRLAFDATFDSASMRAGAALATFEVMASLQEFGLARGLSQIVAVIDSRLERILRRVGISWHRMSDPQWMGNSLAVAGYADISHEILDRVRAIGGLNGPVLSEPVQLKEIA